VVDARLIDLSPGGVKLSLSTPLRFHETVELSLLSEELGLNLAATASVVWSRPGKGANYTVGCSFNPPLVPESLEQLFANGLLERRRARRYSVRGQAQATWELGPAETPVGLLDLSVGGFSLLSPSPASNGSNIRVSMERNEEQSPLDISAAIRWQMQVDGGYVIGCTFKDPLTYSALRNHLLPEEPDLPRFGSVKRTLAVISGGGLLLAALSCWKWMASGGW
jgi:hypothetical protein